MLTGCAELTAQNFPEYCVFLVKGKVTLTNKSNSIIPIKQQQFIYKEEKLFLERNSELQLVNKHGVYLVLKTPGEYQVAGLARKVVPRQVPGITKTYLKLVFHEMLDPDYKYASFKKNNFGGTYGGVSRGDECGNLIFPVKGLKASVDTVHFKWHATSASGEYTLSVYDQSAREILNVPVKDTMMSLHVTDHLKGGPGKYFWAVKSHDGNCEDDPLAFELVNKPDEDKLIRQLIKDSNRHSLLDQLQLINELESHTHIYAAIDQYEKIVHANPGNIILLKSYILFLLKYGFEVKAMEWWGRYISIKQ